MAYILSYGLLGETVLGGSQTTGGNLFCPQESLRFLLGKKTPGKYCHRDRPSLADNLIKSCQDDRKV